jgi:hypothetical protein
MCMTTLPTTIDILKKSPCWPNLVGIIIPYIISSRIIKIPETTTIMAQIIFRAYSLGSNREGEIVLYKTLLL